MHWKEIALTAIVVVAVLWVVNHVPALKKFVG